MDALHRAGPPQPGAAPQGLHRRRLSYAFEQAYPMISAMIGRGGVGDCLAPEVTRFGLVPADTRFADILDAAEILVECLTRQVWRDETLRGCR